MSSSSLRPSESSTLRPLSSAGLCEAETMIPARYGPVRARYARAGVGTTPTTSTLMPRLVAPATIAATNMSPDRRVSWPTTIAVPGPARRRAVARPSANAKVGRRSTLATPRMPSVPKSRPIRLVRRGRGRSRRDGDRDLWRARRDQRHVRGQGRAYIDVGRSGDERRHVKVRRERGPDDPIQIDRVASDGEQHAIDPDVVLEAGLRTDDPHADLEGPGPRHRPDVDRDLDR